MKYLNTVDVEKIFPIKSVSGNNDKTTQPALIGDSYAIFIVRDKLSKKFYDDFYTNYELYLNKLPENYCTKTCSKLLDNKIIFLSTNLKKQKIASTGRYVSSNNKLHAILLDMIELELIDTSSNENFLNAKILVDKIDDAIYTSYFHTIRAACVIHKDKLKKDDELINLSVNYLLFLFLKILSKVSPLNNKQKDILELLIKYFIYKFFLGFTHPISYEKIFEIDKFKSYEKELKDKLTILSKFQQFTDIFIAAHYLNVFSISPSAINLALIQSLQPISYYSIISTFDYLISLICVSQYPSNFFRRGFVDSSIQKKVEEIVYSEYILKMDIDISPIKKYLIKD